MPSFTYNITVSWEKGICGSADFTEEYDGPDFRPFRFYAYILDYLYHSNRIPEDEKISISAKAHSGDYVYEIKSDSFLLYDHCRLLQQKWMAEKQRIVSQLNEDYSIFCSVLEKNNDEIRESYYG